MRRMTTENDTILYTRIIASSVANGKERIRDTIKAPIWNGWRAVLSKALKLKKEIVSRTRHHAT